MSHDVTKTVLRVELPELKGKSRDNVYPVYRDLLGDAPELDMYQGEVEYFSYDGVYRECCDVDSNRWGIERVLKMESEYRTEIAGSQNGYSMGELNEMAQEMAEKFNVDPNQVRLTSYTWYTGTDEPVRF